MDQSQAVVIIGDFVQSYISTDNFRAVFGSHPPQAFALVTSSFDDAMLHANDRRYGLAGFDTSTLRDFMNVNSDKLAEEGIRFCELYLALRALGKV